LAKFGAPVHVEQHEFAAIRWELRIQGRNDRARRDGESVMKSLAFATLMAAMAVSTAFAQAPSPSSNAADPPINVKFPGHKMAKDHARVW
jgi:hypothetical protein